MSLLTTNDEFYSKVKDSVAKGQRGNIGFEQASYQPEGLDRERVNLIRKCFQLGDVTMQKPRPEFNDLSVIGRDQYDKLSFNAYQSNNGRAVAGDPMNSWRSNAMRPIVRDKCISIAAHATARLIFPKVFAYDEENEIQKDAAIVMETLMEWSTRQKWGETSLKVVIEALTSPASILHSEYSEVYVDGKLDEVQSGFIDTIIPVDQLYISNFFEPDIQKQDWLIWRRVQSYQLLLQKYGQKYDNFKYVKPGVQYIYNDANQTFYAVYDTNMQPDECEEIILYHRLLGLQAVCVNGVYLPKAGTDEEKNPRLDQLFPFSKFGYQLINNRCFYYKSLAFYLMQDANIINTLYPMIIDGTYLQIFPPLINRGGEAIRSNVWIPGASVTLSSPQANVEPLNISTPNALAQGVNVMSVVEKSITDSSTTPVEQGNPDQTAYAISVQQQQANTILGPFITMIGSYVMQYGKLRISDIIQHLTVPEVLEIEGNPELVYKSFILRDKTGNHKKVQFDYTMPDKMDAKTKNEWSHKAFDKQGGLKQLKKDGGAFKQKLWIANPSLFRKLKYEECISADVLNPLSEDMERQFGLAQWDRMIQQVPTGVYDAQETGKLLLDIFPKTKKDPDKFMAKQQPGMGQSPQMPPQQLGQQGSPPKPMSPISLKQPAGVGAGLTPMQGQ
jgi:hypothetical protein